MENRIKEFEGRNKGINEIITEHESFNKRNQLLQGIIDNIPDLIFWKDKNSKFLGCNKAFADLIGINTGDIEGKSDSDFIDDKKLADSFAMSDRKVMESGLEESFIEKFFYKEKAFFLYTIKLPIKDKDGNAIGILGISEDITSRDENKRKINDQYSEIQFKNAEIEEANKRLLQTNKELLDTNKELIKTSNQLKYSEQKYRELVEMLPQTVFEIDLEGKIVFVNNYGIKMFGYSKKELKTNFDIKQIFPFEEYKKFKFRLAEKKKGKDLPNSDYVFRKKDGSLFPAIVYSSLMNKEDGDYIKGIVVDVSELRGMKEELVKSERKYFDFAQLLPQTVFEMDLKGNTTFVNKIGLEKFGYTSDDVENGLNTMNLLDDSEVESYKNNLHKVLSQDEFGPVEHVFKRKDGSKLNGVLYHSVVLDGGMPTYINGIIIDVTDEKKTQIALEANEAKYRELAELLPQTVFEFDVDGNFTFVNRQGLKLFGYTQSDLDKGINVKDFLPEEEVPFFEERLAKRIAGENVPFVEYSLIKKNKTRFSGSVSYNIIKEKDKLIAVKGIVIDITRQKETEKSLKELNQNLEGKVKERAQLIQIKIEEQKILLDNIQTLIWYYDTPYTLGIVNKAFEEFFGQKNIDLKGRQFAEIIDSDFAEKCIEQTSIVAETKLAVNFDYWLKDQNKQSQCLSVSLFPKLDNNGKLEFIIASADNITSLKLITSQLENRLEFIENITTISSDLISIEPDKIDCEIVNTLKFGVNFTNVDIGFLLIKSDNNKEISITHEWTKDGIESIKKKFLLSYFKKMDFPNQILELHYSELSKDEENKKLCEILDNLNVKTFIIIPITIGKELKAYLIFNTTKETEKWDKESINAYKIIAQIIANALERKNSHDKILKAKLKAEESDRLKSAFLANMSHEIRTPMNGIIGFTKLIENDNLNEEMRKSYINIIDKSTNQLLTIINDIIDISKIEAGQLELHDTKCTINFLLYELFTFFQSETKIIEKDIQISSKKALSNLNSSIIVDDNRLRQILINLISNALKYTEIGLVEFGYMLPENDKITFFVKDTGIGIPNEKHKMIFDRFVQADNVSSQSGTGLGLSISKGLVELMGGKIWLKSEVGKGTCFYVQIPFSPVQNSMAKQKDKIDKKIIYNWNNKNILIAEDDDTSFFYLKTILEKNNANIIRATDGIKAIEICHSNDEIDLVLMDIQLPGKNGYEAAAEIKKSKQDLIIIAQTANAMVEDKKKAFESGCDDYISKPIDMKILYKTIDKYFD